MELRRAAFILFAVFHAIAACDRSKIEPQIEWGVSTCHRCNSVISSPIWAAADRRQGTVRLYDDPGCLFATLRAEGSTSTDAVFHDHLASGQWLNAADAWFATSNLSKSPQGFGWAAYPSFAAAQDAVTAAGTGRIVRYAEALQSVAADP